MSTEDEKLLKEEKNLLMDERLRHKNDANIDLAELCDSITDPKDARLRKLGFDSVAGEAVPDAKFFQLLIDPVQQVLLWSI